MRFLSADIIFPVHTQPIANGILAVGANGAIHDVLLPDDENAPDASRVERFDGILCPGFVNAHCHLELSHMKGLVTEKTGLPKFITEIVGRRHERQDEKLELIRRADSEMWENGIQAVGDICNTTDALAIKQQSRINYHSFVEVFSFDPAKADMVLTEGIRVAGEHDLAGLSASIVPHAPYSVCSRLFEGIALQQQRFHGTVSMHNQETLSEDEMFVNGTGALLEAFNSLGVDVSGFKPECSSSLAYALPKLTRDANVVLVHNTCTSQTEMMWANGFRDDLFWCTCPNANKYIEDRVPDIQIWANAGATVCIGTDSLASNHELSVLSEMKLIQNTSPAIGLSELIRMATLNGARALNLDKKIGSFQKGKLPGIIWLKDVEISSGSLRSAAVQRIV